MLRELSIKDFKSIRRAKLSFGRSNLFIGPNGAGKSNALEALGVVSAALSRGIDQESLDLKGVRLSLPRLFKSAFKNRDLPNAFTLTAKFDHGYYTCSIRSSAKSSFLEFTTEALFDNGHQVFGRGPRGTRIYRKIGGGALDLSRIDSTRSLWDAAAPILDVSDGLSAEIKALSDFRIYNPQTSVMRGVANDPRIADPLGLTGSGLAAAFNDAYDEGKKGKSERAYIDNIISVIWEPGWADQIRIRPFDPEIVPGRVRSEGSLIYIRDRFMKINRNFVSPYDASEGTLYLIFVATLLAHPRTPRSFGLDNVDSTLNPALVRKLTKHIVDVCSTSRKIGAIKQDHQSFLTSHHPSSLDSFDIFDPSQCIFIVTRSAAEKDASATTLTELKPPVGMSKERWSVTHNGEKLSQLLLERFTSGLNR